MYTISGSGCKKISGLAPATTVDYGDQVELLQSGDSLRADVSLLGMNPFSYVMSEQASAGATTITLNPIPVAGVNSRAVLLAIEPFSTNCELRRITGLTGAVVTINDDLVLTHAQGTNVLFLPTSEASPALFGMLCDGSTDEWSSCQRMFIQSNLAGCGIVGAGGLNAVADIRIHQPLLVSSLNRAREISISSPASGFGYVAALPNAMVILANRQPQTFTATASDDTFTVGTAPGHSVGNTIAFNAPYGETLPGGVTAGRVYYIKTIPISTTFTISETDGGATLNLTSDGSGWCYARITSLSRLFWDSVRLTLNQADLNGLHTNLQQPGYCRNLRIEMNVAGTALADSQAIGWHLVGQVSVHQHVEINPATNCTGLKIESGIVSIFGLNMNGLGRGILINSSAFGAPDAIQIDGVLFEGCVVGVEFMGEARGVSFGTVYSNATTTFKVRAGTSPSWSVQHVRVTATGALLVDDLERAYQILAWSGSGDAITSDQDLIFGPFKQTGGYSAPSLLNLSPKRSLSKTASLDFPSIAAQTSQELTVTVTGAATTDVAVASPDDATIEANLCWSAYVSAANTVKIRLTNPTGSAIDPAVRTWRVVVHQF